VYNWLKDIAQWRIKDTLYLSVVFSWDLDKALRVQEQSKLKVIVGGPAAKLAGIQPDEPLSFSPLQFHNPLATFTTRGCPNACEFCAVPKIEGNLRELPSWEIKPVICDNNLLAASQKHFDRVIDSLKSLPYVDFNQGVDAYLFTDHHARRMAELRAVKVRFAFDSVADETAVMDAIARARSHGLKDIGVYVLFGFRDTPEDARYRLETIRRLDIWPNPMRFQPLNSQTKNSFVEEGWTKKQLEDTERYYARLRYLEHIPFEDYRCGNYTQQGALI
jgi:MoaA/NifB/PqqE/SkfB family radical SAM enzyme